MDEEAELVRAVVGGDSERFGPLVERYQRPVVRFARNLIDDGQEAEDVAQEVFLAAFRNLGTFDARKGRFSTWLLTIARNRCLNVLRGRRPAPDDGLHEVLQPTAVEPMGMQEHLDRAFARLPVEQRSAFLLAEVEQLSYQDIARIEGVRVGTVKSRIHRARERLRSLLEHVREDT